MSTKILIVFLIFILSGSVSAQVLTDSNLPIIIINIDGGVEIGFERVPGSMKIIYRGEGQRTYVSDQNNTAYVNYNGRIEIKIRGSYSSLFPKTQYGFTTRKADNIANNNVSLLGMPEENDWILNGMILDPARMRDYLAYNLSRQTEEYASRAVYCELIINGEYNGLYLLAEKIKADDNRVNVIKIESDDLYLPELSGGYITAVDLTSDMTFPFGWTLQTWTGKESCYSHILPKPEEIKPAQHDYIRNQFTSLENTAQSGNVSKANGFPSIIDVPSFIHFILINEIAFNGDSYVNNTYFHKDRNGKLRAVPVWDFDGAFGNNPGGTNVWKFSFCADRTDWGGYLLWKSLLDNPVFRCYLSRRWNELTQPGQPLNLSSIEAFIDQTVATISEAVARDFARWGIEGTHEQYISGLKAFFAARIPVMTANLGPCSSCTDIPVPPLVITKIMYHPGASLCSSGDDDLEFLELTNNSDSTIDLTGIYFGGTGFVCQFPVNSKLGPHSSAVLASNAWCFLSEYGFKPFAQFTRHLSNKSENLVLLDAFGNIIDHVKYFDSYPWPDADGNGYYLILKDINLDNNVAGNWSISNDKTKIANNRFYSIVKKCLPDTIIREGFGQTVPAPVTTLKGFLEGGGTVRDSCGIASFSHSENGQGTNPMVIVRTYSVKDYCGNSDFCQQTLLVYRRVSLSCPPVTAVFCSKPAPYRTVEEFIKAGGTVNIPTDKIVSLTWEGDVSDHKKCPETITRSYRIVDFAGQPATCTQTLAFNEQTLPVLKMPVDMTIQCPQDPPGKFGTYAQFVSAGGLAVSNCGFDESSFRLQNETWSQEKCPQTLSRIYEILNSCGDKATGVHKILIYNTKSPEVMASPPYIRSCTTIGNKYTLSTWIAAGGQALGCNLQELKFISEFTIGSGCPGKIVRKYELADQCNNRTPWIDTLFIEDNYAPVFTRLPQPVISTCVTVPYFADYAAFYQAGGKAKDNCELKTETFVLVKEVVLKEKCPKIMERTYSIEDWCGNRIFFNDTLTIRDVVPSEMIISPLYTQITTGKDIPPPFTLEEFMGAIGETFYCGIAEFEMASQDSVNTGTNLRVTRIYRITDLCGLTHECTHVIDMIPTGTENMRSEGFKYSIVPNPNRGKFTLRIDSNYMKDLTLKLLNPLGQVIETRTVKSTGMNYPEQFNVIYLSKGIYFLVISSEDYQSSRKIIAQ